ncbi:MAG: helix-turn-helix transcriptional regulator [Clostridia bacterium]|nr:helix-turn-helix transcriptional regulator [Clostridia bacterium]
MEPKTIGSFIAALRRANGMTQRELAERLNVSDKSVSRWERDDAAPDLSLIPVIAEIFGVTCDELLRGERKPQSEQLPAANAVLNPQTPGETSTEDTAAAPPLSTKAEKQRRHLMKTTLDQHTNGALVTLADAFCGFIAAMICNLGFNRAYIGFFVGLIFFLSAIFLQIMFFRYTENAFSDADTVSGTELGSLRFRIVRQTEYALGITAILFAITLPLIIFPTDTYMGLTAKSWFLSGVCGYGLAALVLVCVVCWFINGHLLDCGYISLDEKEETVFRYRHKLKKTVSLSLAAVLGLTLIVYYVITQGQSAAAFAPKITFDNFEDFTAYMEQDIPYESASSYAGQAEEPVSLPQEVDGTHIYYDADGNEISEEEARALAEALGLAFEEYTMSDTVYYDQYGNMISEEEALKREILDRDGNVVCTYLHRNETVSVIEYGADILPITVITHDALGEGRRMLSLIGTVFTFISIMECGAAWIWYLRKRKA